NEDIVDVMIDYLNAKREDEQYRIEIGLLESFNDGDTFYAYAGTGRNPQKPKEIINIPAKNVVKFSAAKYLRRAVAGH
ncbi:MAG: HU family DNA-binding protein, partial [Bacteroidales bacterium]|nr:HU family DNA-binding protein [Bacteroidales bacterium]